MYGICQWILMRTWNIQQISVKFVTFHSLMRWSSSLCRSARNYWMKSGLLAGEEAWVYSYDPETIQLCCLWKSPFSPCPKKARQVRTNTKSVFVICFDCEALFLRNLFLQTKCYTSITTGKFFSVWGSKCTESLWNSGGARTAWFTMTVCLLTLLSVQQFLADKNMAATWSLVISSCFWGWNHSWKRVVSRMSLKCIYSRWPSYTRFKMSTPAMLSEVSEMLDQFHKLEMGLLWRWWWPIAKVRIYRQLSIIWGQINWFAD